MAKHDGLHLTLIEEIGATGNRTLTQLKLLHSKKNQQEQSTISRCCSAT